PVQFRQADVDDGHVGAKRQPFAHSLRAILRDLGLVAEQRQQQAQRLAAVWMVLDDQDTARSASISAVVREGDHNYLLRGCALASKQEERGECEVTSHLAWQGSGVPYGTGRLTGGATCASSPCPATQRRANHELARRVPPRVCRARSA